MKMSNENFQYTLDSHTLWLNDKEGGFQAILRDEDLRHADFSGAILTEAILENADLRGANFKGATLDKAVTDYLTNKGECVSVIEG